MDDLTCDVCMNYYRIPIYQCGNGHSICNKCLARLQLCPMCRQPYSSPPQRNYRLEQDVLLGEYSCPNDNPGCRTGLDYFETHEHKRQCPLEPLICPVIAPLCRKHGTRAEIFKHMLNEHKSFILIPSFRFKFVLTQKYLRHRQQFVMDYDNTKLIWGFKCLENEFGHVTIAISIQVFESNDLSDYEPVIFIWKKMFRLDFVEHYDCGKYCTDYLHVKLKRPLATDETIPFECYFVKKSTQFQKRNNEIAIQAN